MHIARLRLTLGIVLAVLAGGSRTASGTARLSYVGHVPGPPSIAIALSPDDAHVYVLTTEPSSVHAFARDPLTGGLTAVGSVAAPADESAEALIVSPDGLHVYAGGDTIATFGRNPATGVLTAAGTAGFGATSLAISPDGAHVYATEGDGVEVWSRDGVTGALSFVEQHDDPDGPGGSVRLSHAGPVTVSPDGASVYVPSYYESALTVFARNAGTGMLTPVQLLLNGMGGISGDALRGPRGVRISPDGLHAYVAAGITHTAHDAVLALYTRNPGDGTLTPGPSWPNLLLPGPKEFRLDSLVMSPEGGWLYATSRFVTGLFGSSTPGALKVFRRDPGTGTVEEMEDLIDAQEAFALDDPLGAVPSADGRHLYTTSGEATVVILRTTAAACSPTPQPACRQPTQPGAASLTLADEVDDSRDNVVWQWARGAATPFAALEDPRARTDLALCLYDAAGLRLRIDVPAAGVCNSKARVCWRRAGSSLNPKGYTYRDNYLTPDGAGSAKLRAGDTGRAKILVNAKRERVPMPSLPLTPPVVVQLQATNGECWGAVYSMPTRNDVGGVTARSD